MALSRDQMAQRIFEEIRERPYRVKETAVDESNNCAKKNLELSQRLAMLRYEVRGRLVEFEWAEMGLPADILALYPDEFPATHYYLEVCENGKWRALDASWDSRLAQTLNYRLCDWQNGQAGLTSTHDYNGEELAAYLQTWWDQQLVADYFLKAGPFLVAVNQWLTKQRLQSENISSLMAAR